MGLWQDFYSRKNKQANPYLSSNDPTTTIANYEERLARSGVASPEVKSGGTNNLLMKALDILDRPRNAVVTGIDEAFNPDKNKASSVGEAMMNGLLGKDTVSVSDWLPKNNGDGKIQVSEALWGALGFAGDVLLDPLTYTGVGAAKSIGVQGVKRIATKAGKEIFEGNAKLAAKAAKQAPEDIARLTGKAIDGRISRSDLDPVVTNALKELDEAKEELNTVSAKVKNKLFSSLGVDAGRMNPNILGVDDSLVPKYKGYAAKFRGLVMKDAKLRERIFGTYDEMGAYIPGEFASLSKYFTKSYVKASDAVQRGKTLSPKTDAFYQARKAEIDKEFSSLMQGIYGEGAMEIDFGKFSVALDLGVNGSKLKELAKEADELTGAFKNVGEKRTTVTYVNGLQTIIDHANKQWQFKFMGKPVFSAEPLQKVASNVGEALYKRLPHRGKKAVDILLSVFDPHYVSLAAKEAGDATFKLLQQAEEATTKQVAMSAGIVDRANAFVTSNFSIDIEGAVDHRLLTDERLAKSMGYYVEAKQAMLELSNNDLLLAKKARGEVVDDTALLSDGDIKLRQLTIDRYAEVKTTMKLTEEDEKYLELGSDKFALAMAAIAGADQGLGVMYDGARGYFPHFYDKDLLGTRNVAAMYQTKDSIDELSGNLANAEKRDFYSMAHAEKNGLKPITDYRSVAGLRYMDSQRVYLHKEFIDTLTGLTAVGKTEKGKSYRARIFHTKQNTTRSLQKVSVPGFENYYADPEVIRQIQRMRNVFISNESFMETLRYFDLATNVIKKLQTSMSPSFVVRNVAGETYMNFMAGVGVGAHITAGKIIKDTASSHTFLDDTMFVHRGKPLVYIHTENGTSKLVRPQINAEGHVVLDPETGKPVYHNADLRYSEQGAEYSMFNNEFKNIDKDPKARKALQEQLRKEARRLLDEMDEGQKSPKYKLGGKEYYAFEIQDMMRMGGLKHSGMTRGNLVEGFEANIKQTFSPTKAAKFWDWPVKFADNTETFTRMAHLLQRLDDGYDITDAVRDVKKYHVDYKDLTPMERGLLRRVMPYYTYMRKNTPIQLRVLMEHPAAFTSMGRLTNQMYENMGDPEAPDYLKRNMAIPIGRNGEDVTYLNLNMPMNDVGRINFERDQLIKENVIDMLHPGIKSLFELHSNQSLTFGTPIERYEGEKAEIIKGLPFTSAPKEIDYMLQQMGVINQLRMFASDMIGYRPETSQGVPLPRQIPMVSSLLPVKNVQHVEAGKAYERRDQLSDYIKKTEADGTPIMTYEQLQKIRKNNGNFIPPTPTI